MPFKADVIANGVCIRLGTRKRTRPIRKGAAVPAVFGERSSDSMSHGTPALQPHFVRQLDDKNSSFTEKCVIFRKHIAHMPNGNWKDNFQPSILLLVSSMSPPLIWI
jgi:hypothetical protein